MKYVRLTWQGSGNQVNPHAANGHPAVKIIRERQKWKSSTYDQNNRWGLVDVYGLHIRYIFALVQQVGKHIFQSSVHNPLLQNQTPNTHKLKPIWHFSIIIHYFQENNLVFEINSCLLTILIIEYLHITSHETSS